jgi:carbonic anhydrase
MRLIKIISQEQIPEDIFNTPVGMLLKYHNLLKDFDAYSSAQILVGMCMDNRKQLRIPENFAYIIRTGGANLRYSEFKVSYAIAIGEVKQIALIAHDNCGMVNLVSKREQFIEGLQRNAGWSSERAQEHFMNYAPLFEIDNEIEFVVNEAKRLSQKYSISAVPLYYSVEDNMLSMISE